MHETGRLRDHWVLRKAEDYATAFSKLLPTGTAWPRDRDSVLMRTVRGLTKIWELIESRARDLLVRESDPRTTVELLPDWERNWGLPDPCFASPQTIDERQKILVEFMTLEGAQSRDFFISVMARLGHTIGIREWSPFMAGISRVGDTRGEWGEIFFGGDRTPVSGEPDGGEVDSSVQVSGDRYDYRWEIGPPEIRYYWSIRVDMAKLSWFRAASGQAGVDPHLRIGLSDDLECLLNRWKPAHTDIVFDYSGLRYGGSMQGTP
jgi:uncharacterized protein YmfQ (DUF2313 family)